MFATWPEGKSITMGHESDDKANELCDKLYRSGTAGEEEIRLDTRPQLTRSVRKIFIINMAKSKEKIPFFYWVLPINYLPKVWTS